MSFALASIHCASLTIGGVERQYAGFSNTLRTSSEVHSFGIIYLVATFTNDRVGLCANVRELPESEEFEVAVVDGFSGDVVVSPASVQKRAQLRLLSVS
jgi:hypothetical protein